MIKTPVTVNPLKLSPEPADLKSISAPFLNSIVRVDALQDSSNPDLERAFVSCLNTLLHWSREGSRSTFVFPKEQ